MIHVTVVKWITYLFGVMCIIMSLVVGLFAIIGGGALSFLGEEEGAVVAGIVSGVFGIIFAIIMLIAGILYIVAGGALGSFRNWARWYVTICIGIPNIGVLWGIYVIWALFFNQEVKAAFENRY